MTDLAVFAYGSLVLPESAAATLGRPVEPLEPVRLHGWRRRWSVYRDNHNSEKVFAREPGGELPPFVIGLNLEPGGEPDEAPNGALLAVSEAELARLDVREMRYDRVEVGETIDPAHDFDAVFAYSAKPEHFAPQPPPGAVAMATYQRVLERGFNALGPSQWQLFDETTGPAPVETIEARLIEDKIPPGNPREW